MARGRMVSNTLGRSEKFNALPSDFDRLLYVLALTHADAEGRIEANAKLLKADCFPLSEATPDQVERGLRALADVHLLQLYEVGGKRYAEFEDFHKHNTVRRHKHGPEAGQPSKEAPSRIPPPPEETGPSRPARGEGGNDSGATPDPVRTDGAPIEVKEKGNRNRSEGEARESAPPPTPYGDRPSPEERLDQLARTGIDPTKHEHRTRERLRRLAGGQFTTDHADDIPRWSREHQIDRLDALWEASDKRHWRGTKKADKRRVWIFEDLLNGDVEPPTEHHDALSEYVEAGL